MRKTLPRFNLQMLDDMVVKAYRDYNANRGVNEDHLLVPEEHSVRARISELVRDGLLEAHGTRGSMSYTLNPSA